MNTTSDTDVLEALTSVLGGLLAHAETERRAATPYQMLFGAFKDGGVGRAVLEAEKQMRAIAMDLAQVLKDATGKPVDHELYAVLNALPLALDLLKDDVTEKDGFSCSSDKARMLLRTYCHERLALDVEKIPFSPPSAPPDAS